MNNEINRRDFMRLSAASIMTASVTLNLGNTAFATAASEDPKDVLKNFFESFSPADHESWVNYFASSVYGYYREFAQNAFNQAKRLGLLDIDKAELLYAEKVNNVYAPKYLNLTGTMILAQIMPATRLLQIWKPKRANISGMEQTLVLY